MLRSVEANKKKIRAMCASEDLECKALYGKDMDDTQWNILKVWTSFYAHTLTLRIIRSLHVCSVGITSAF